MITENKSWLLDLCRHWFLPLAASALIHPFCIAETSQANSKPILSIVIDDIGYNRASARKLIALPYPLTFSVLPQSPFGKELAQLAWIRGKEVMLHIPMATQTNSKLDPGGIPLSMPTARITELLTEHIHNFPQAIGINNHMGSRLTEISPAMDAVMQALKPEDLFFIDSRTSAQSVAFNQAKKAGLAAAKRDVFLDNEQSVAEIAAQLEKAVALAEKNGSALAIGHPYPETIAALQAHLPELMARVELVPSSIIMRTSSHNLREPYRIYNDATIVNTPWTQASTK